MASAKRIITTDLISQPISAGYLPRTSKLDQIANKKECMPFHYVLVEILC
uniref:Uncharacterized protein n=1 Tax=Arundo donax TaxID=35708 RepID=A0A0A9BRE9_ARUDO